MLGRPPILFYLAPSWRRRDRHRAPASSDDLLTLMDGGWAIVDTAMLRQEGDPDHRLARLRERWEIAATIPTTLSNATLLDVDPAAAVGDLWRGSSR